MFSVPADNFKDLMEERELSSLEKFNGLQGIVESLKTDVDKGITDLNSLEARREHYGANVLPDPKQKSWIRLFFEAITDKMLIILMVASIISLILVLIFPDPEEPLGWIDSVSILVAVVIVSLVQSITDYRQQKAFAVINRMKNDNLVAVIRNGDRIKIPATEVVVGDVLYLDAGNKLVADGLFINGRGLKLNESETTGETVAVSVSSEKPFMCAGSMVEAGDGRMLAICVGTKTQTGAIFGQMGVDEEELTPLQEKLDKLANGITWFGLGGALLTFAVLLVMWGIDLNKTGWNDQYANQLIRHFMVGVTIFVCAVPEGLPLAVTLSLSYSMKRMMDDNNFVRHLDACETMGGASNICSDKTGTLTTNRMTVTQFYYGDKDYSRDEIPEMNDELKDIFGIGISVNTKGKVSTNDKGVLVYDGKSTECALCLYVEKMGYNYEQIRQDHPTSYLFDFDSDRKRMTTVIKHPRDSSKDLVCSKGAPDVMMNFVTQYVDEKGKLAPFSEEVRERINAQLLAYSRQMLRCLLIAYRIGGECSTPEEAEKNLIMIGVAAISDPIRPEVPNAVKECRIAGVMVRMVTGDNIETAKAIAKECGILSEDGICMTGNEFRQTPKLELLEKLPKLQVLARSTPMDKFRLVRILKELGEVVAVTGDGTNDALALRTANVGLSMGLCGTEIAKEASDICILDDNFKSIMMAIMWGRCVFDNVRRFLQFQLTVNISAVVIAFLGSCIWQESPLTPIQLLWVNLIMDSLGALALATEKPRPYLLQRPPYGRKVQLLSGVLLVNIIGQAIYQIAVLVVVLVLGPKIWTDLEPHGTRHYTLVFNCFVFMQIFNLLNSRVVAKAQKFMDGIFSNLLFIGIFVFISCVQAVIIEFGGVVFQTNGLKWIHWVSVLGIGFVSLILGAILRLIPVKELSYEEVEFQREEMYESLKESLRGMTEEEQWAQENAEAAQEQGKINNKKKEEEDVKKVEQPVGSNVQSVSDSDVESDSEQERPADGSL